MLSIFLLPLTCTGIRNRVPRYFFYRTACLELSVFYLYFPLYQEFSVYNVRTSFWRCFILCWHAIITVLNTRLSVPRRDCVRIKLSNTGILILVLWYCFVLFLKKWLLHIRFLYSFGLLRRYCYIVASTGKA